MEFIRIEPGQFMMGCSPGDNQCEEDEKPAHLIRITKAFEISKYEVTQSQWELVMGSNPSYSRGADRPVEQVSWDEVQEFLRRLNARRDGYRYRLPTEAEWEYAARAGSTGPYAGPLDQMAWYRPNSGGQTHPVGQKQPNAWGLYDTHGNVGEWVQDWYSPNSYPSTSATDPTGPPRAQFRVLRGGTFLGDARFKRLSERLGRPPDYKNNSIGFRCVREAIR
jgi:formylglycine-generating enzyme required for sulfatase activity